MLRTATIDQHRVRLAVLLVAACAMVAALLPQPAGAQPLEADCRSLPGNKPVEGFLSYDEVVQRLDRIERTSKGNVEVDVAGQTNQGRDIYTARVGEGDTVVLIQSQIHGNEMHGTTALLNLLQTLGNNSPRSQEIREAVTVVAIPQLNADGGALNQRRNDMTWEDAVEAFPQLADASEPAWNYSSWGGGYDVNRDFNPDLDYVPDPDDFPGSSAGTGWYITPEAQTVRDVYRSLEQEFGIVDIFVDLHNQGPCYTDTDYEDYTTLSISGRFIADPTEFGDWPNFDYDASRRVNVAVYDALQVGNSPTSSVSLYPQSTNLPGTALGSFGLRGSATILFETRGQTQSWGQKQMGVLIKQVERGMFGILDAVTDGTLDDIDPDRYESIPERRYVPRD